MKIVYIISRLNNAGPVNQLYSLIGWMKDHQECIIYTLYPENDDTRIGDFQKINVRIRCADICSQYNIVFMRKKISKMLKEDVPDIVHTEGLPADLIMARHNRSVIWCSTLHSNIYCDYKLGLPKVKAYVYKKLHEYCIKRMNVIIACSFSISDEYKKRFPNKKVIAIQNGVCVTKRNKEYEKIEAGVNKKILVIGSLNARKNSLFIIESLMEWVKIRKVLLIFLGDGEMYAECKEKAATNPFIILKGKVSNVEDFLKESEICISASYSEGLPMAVIEAGMAGNKLVLSDIPQHKELGMYKNVEGIYYFKNNNKFDLVDKLDQAINSKERREAISEYFYLNFSNSNMGKKYNDVYRELLGMNNDIRI